MSDFIKLKGKIAEQPLESFRDDTVAPHKKSPRWVVVADKNKALIFKVDKNNLETIGEAYPDAPYEKIQSNEHIGRGNSRVGEMRHGKEPPHDSQHHEERFFLKELAGILDKAANKKTCDEIVLCAAPASLGMLRQELSAPVSNQVVAELGKDLSNHPVPKIEDVLSQNKLL